MHERIFDYLAGLSFTKFASLAVTGGTGMGVILGEMLTSQWGAAGLAGVMGGMFTTAMVVIPRVMEQRRKGRESDSAVREQETNALIQRMADVHQKEIMFYKLQVAETMLTASLERKAKHAVISQVTALQGAYQLLVAQLKAAHVAPAIEVSLIGYDKMVGEADSKIQEIRESSVDMLREAAMTANEKEKAEAAIK